MTNPETSRDESPPLAKADPDNFAFNGGIQRLAAFIYLLVRDKVTLGEVNEVIDTVRALNWNATPLKFNDTEGQRMAIRMAMELLDILDTSTGPADVRRYWFEERR